MKKLFIALLAMLAATALFSNDQLNTADINSDIETNKMTSEAESAFCEDCDGALAATATDSPAFFSGKKECICCTEEETESYSEPVSLFPLTLY